MTDSERSAVLGLIATCERHGIDNVFLREARQLLDGNREDVGRFVVCDDGAGPYWFGGCPGDKDVQRWPVGQAIELAPGGESWPVGSRVEGTLPDGAR